jgi:hypothetical protein
LLQIAIAGKRFVSQNFPYIRQMMLTAVKNKGLAADDGRIGCPDCPRMARLTRFGNV